MAYLRPKIIILFLAVLLDLIIGDPHFLWHPVRGIGKLINWFEKLYRKIFAKREFLAGALLAISVLIVTGGITILIFYIFTIIENNISVLKNVNAFVQDNFGINGMLTFLFSLILTTQCLSARQLSRESNRVYVSLHKNNLVEARRNVSMIVGRDTENLSYEGVTKAAVETIAENTSDGVIAPMFYLILFGPLGGIIYKAINTMDSMIGYKNDRYIHFGTFAARLDDVVNFFPARISGFLMVVSAFFTHFDGKNAWKIWRKDSRKSKSPNSAQCEAAAAGALDISLLGNAYYFGVLFEKPTIGDPIRPLEAEDIKRTEKLMYMTEALFMALSALILWGIFH
jgi:adenosylcobinamide-phosphate synthase